MSGRSAARCHTRLQSSSSTARRRPSHTERGEARCRTEPSCPSTAPTTLELSRKNSYVVTATRDGYAPAEATIRKGMRGGILALDILFTGLLGVVVDAATGGWWDLSPNDVTLVLERRDASLDGPDEVRVHLALDEDASTPALNLSADHEGVTVTVRPID
jgi:hypothetical protein